MTLQGILLLTSALFCLGLYGMITRRNAIGILLSLELMANSVNINLAAFSHYQGGHAGQVFAVFTTALTVAEAVVGLAIVILLYRWRKHVAVDAAQNYSG